MIFPEFLDSKVITESVFWILRLFNKTYFSELQKLMYLHSLKLGKL